MTALQRLGDEKYLLLTTFRKDGRAVPTPVWGARDGDTLVVWTVRDSWKVKRIRRNGEVRVAACDVRGKPRGEEVPGQASVEDAAGDARIRKIIARKYGVLGRLTMLGSRLRRGTDGSVGIRIVLVD